MEPISTFLTVALGYILKGAAQSKTAQTAKEELLGSFWEWIRPLIFRDVPEIVEKPEAEETEIKTSEKLIELIKNEDFLEELAKRVSELQRAGIKEKNIVRKDIINVKRIIIGDKEYNPDDIYQRKNIVEGNTRDADEFILGDGH
jgi:hypothetical protein